MPAKTPRKSEYPIFWIVAGPNGSGKSSLYNLTLLEDWGGSVWIINPDLLTATILEHERLPLREANLAAVQRGEAWLDTSIAAYQTIGVETVVGQIPAAGTTGAGPRFRSTHDLRPARHR
ncbi:hypothetical protein [Sphingomonas sp.]|uniref:hypothetical protein n=1 Tax=Sphingomonas sp. TaxID=28214 RepID=UPI003CC584AC